MSDSENPRIFASYTGDMDEYADVIIKWLRDKLVTEIYNWRRVPIAAGGEKEDLRRKVESASVFIAFISDRYKEGIAAEELQWCLQATHQKKMYFVPFIFSTEAQKWWNEIKNSDNTPANLKDLFEARFYRGDEIFPPVANMLGSAESVVEPRIRAQLSPLVARLKTFLAEQPTDGKNGVGSKASEEPTSPPPSEDQLLFVLGHPYDQLTDGAAAARDKLLNGLKASDGSARLLPVPDKWVRNFGQARACFESARGHPTHFIQVANVEFANELTNLDDGKEGQEAILKRVNEEASKGADAAKKLQDVINKILWVPSELQWTKPSNVAKGGFELAVASVDEMTSFAQAILNTDRNADLLFQPAFPDLNNWTETSFGEGLGVKVKARRAFIEDILNELQHSVEKSDRIPLIIILNDLNIAANSLVRDGGVDQLMSRIRDVNRAIYDAKLQKSPEKIVKIMSNINTKIKYDGRWIRTSEDEWVVLPIRLTRSDDKQHFNFQPDTVAINYIRDLVNFSLEA